ncbi:MAG TPA: fumarylacetoacetate hydrolase family protein [Trebonia sp.]|nr:fumarylacetoacetate hydrolase family protein [Trebonia sp.]
MQLASTRGADGRVSAVARLDEGPYTPTAELLGDQARGGDLLDLLCRDQIGALQAALERGAHSAQAGTDPFDAPYRRPRKILGIGLNYRAHASDLGADAPRKTPASFLKGDHTIIGPGEAIQLPAGIGRVTAEAEVGLVIGRPCYRVGVDEAWDYVAGLTAVLDQTAEEVLLENPRYLTRVKNYPTFFSFGPWLVTTDEARRRVGDLSDLVIATRHNGVVHRQAPVADMIFSPAELLSFHSHVMPLYPGDILSTGTPGAVAIEPGDEVSCELAGLMTLTNPVRAQDGTT